MNAVGRSILKQSVPVLVLTTLGGVVAGLFLKGMENELNMVPGLLILLPAILGMRGNISGALGSRLSSALHLGLIKPELKMNETLRTNIVVSLILNITMSLLLGVVAYYAYLFFGFQNEMQASIIHLTLISLIAGTLAGLLMTALSISIAILTYSKGLDPDNILAPSLATVGDILTVLCLLIATRIVI